MDKQLQQVTDTFIQAVKANDTISTFIKASQVYQEDQELQELHRKFESLVETFQQKQVEGTLTQDDIDEIRSIQNKVNRHPITKDYLQAQEAAQSLLNECNQTISHILGFDFSATAAPAAAC